MANLPLEIKFAQSLAGNEKKHRDRAVKKLQKYFHSKSSSKKEGFTQEDFLKIWKGLHYCMWMQDKALIQEELSATLSGLVHNLVTTDAQLLFIRVFFITEAREWNSIDVWRIDKFMMFVRNMLNESFVVLKKHKWSPALTSSLTRVFMDTLMSPNNSSIPDGLKIHFADIYLDEVEKVGGNQLKSSQLIELLEPFTRFLQTCPNMALIRRTVERIFKPITNCALHVHKRKHKATLEDEEEDVPYIKLKFDWEKLADHIFKVSQEPVVLTRNRPVMYSLVTELKDAAQGVGKKEEDEEVPIGITDKDFSKAINSLVSSEIKQVKQKKHKKSKKDTGGDSEGKENEHSEVDSNCETSNSDREQPSTSGHLSKKKRKLNTPVASQGQNEPLAKIKKTVTTPVEPPSEGKKTLKSLKNKFNSLSKLGRSKEKIGTLEDGVGTNVKEHRMIKHAVSKKRQSLLSSSPWTVTSSPATGSGSNVKSGSITMHGTSEGSVTVKDKASVKNESKIVKQLQGTPNSESVNSEKRGKAKKRSHTASEAGSGSSGSGGSANKMPIPKIVVEDTGKSKIKTDNALQEGEVEIWVPNKKYKGYKEASPKSDFAQFDQSKPPAAFVKKAMLKANMTPDPRTPRLSPNSALQTPGTSKTPGSSKKVSFNMKKNQSQGFVESLNSPVTPFNPTKQPDQGILKASAGTSSSGNITTSASVSTSNIPSGSKLIAKKQLRGTPILSGGLFKNKAKRMRAVDFFM